MFKFILIVMSFSFLYGEVVNDCKIKIDPHYNNISNEINIDKETRVIRPRLRVIGWSSSNLFAYILQEPNEARGFEIANLIIQNMKTDAILEKKSWHFEDDCSFDKSIALYDDMIYSIINKYHIKSLKVDLNNFPIVLDGARKISTSNKSCYCDDTDYFNEPFMTSMTLKLTILDKYDSIIKEKLIYKSKFRMDEQIYIFSVSGYINSPYSNTIAILLVKTYRGWEGPPSVMDYQFVGASLLKRFKKPKEP